MAAFTVPLRPPPLIISKTCIYKSVGNVHIPLDIYLPETDTNSANNNLPSPPHLVMVFIHGGGWTGGTRTDYSRPLFKRFLNLGFVVLSVDYRLLPETSFEGQQEDIRDVEPWVRSELEKEIKDRTLDVDTGEIVVVGASSGALLALLTPKLWASPPAAILSMYGPTNLHYLPYLGRGRLSGLQIPECTPELLAKATDFENPPTEIGVPATSEDCVKPRGVMSLHLFRRAVLAEFLVGGLVRGKEGELSLPEREVVGEEEVEGISPIHILPTLSSPHPPTLQIIGTEDSIFQPSHVHAFDAALKKCGVTSRKVVVQGEGHAFDIWAEIGSDIDRDVLGPGVRWIAQRLGRGGGESWWEWCSEGGVWRWRGWRFWRCFGRGR